MVATLVHPRPVTGPSAEAFGAFADAVCAAFDVDKAVLLSTMPRGGLQVCRSSAGIEPGARRYGTDLHAHDYAAWKALTAGHDAAADPAVDAVFGGGLAGVLSVRVESPVFAGYPGVVRLLRQTSAGGGTPDADRVRALFHEHFPTGPDTADRQFVFAGGRDVLGDPSAAAAGFGPGVRAMAGAAAKRVGSFAGREMIPDEDGVRVAVQVAKFEPYPALGDGPAVFVSVSPRVDDWSALRPDAFAADAELYRLVGAVEFMTREFRRSPTLGDVADSVHLSQFHFHRRFTDLLGLTPKHLLYDLQLNEARRMLADPQQPLASIARQCGFAHQSHFTSRFKQGTGLTPTRWRRRETGRPTAV